MLNFIKSNRFLILFAVGCLILYGSFAYDLQRSDFVKLISLYAALFYLTRKLIKMYGWNFSVLVGIGIVYRFALIIAFPNLSQDFYRFIWDGRLILEGINPYLYSPMEIMESGVPKIAINQGAEIYSGLTELNAGHFSNYPPINQLFFFISAVFGGNSILGSIVVMRLSIILADIGILYVGKKLLEHFKLPIQNIFWYFLNPFIIIELTANLHFEGVMLFFVLSSLYLLFKGKWMWAAILMGISVSVKLIPLLFLPLLLQWFIRIENPLKGLSAVLKFYLVVLSTVILTFLPFFSSEFISNFGSTILLWFQEFEFNASIYYIIRWIGFKTIGWNLIATVGKILPAVIILFTLNVAFFRRNKSEKQLITAMLLVISFYLLLSTTIHPWYIATPLLLSIFTKYRFPIVWSCMVMLSYSAYGVEGFNENLWIVGLEYIITIGYAIWEFYTKNRRDVHQTKHSRRTETITSQTN
jgi:alpha-1,6-mannosyltransferase